MQSFENMAFMATFVGYSAAIIFYVWYFASRNESIGKLATIVTALGWVTNTVALTIRTLNAGRLPLTNGYEFLLAFAWGIVLVYLWFQHRYRVKTVGAFVLPIAWILLAYVAVKIPIDQRMVAPLMPALKSNWLTVHVATAIVAYGTFALSFGLALMYLLKARHDSGSESTLSRLPAGEWLDELSYQAIMFGFLFLGLVIVTGAIWAEQAWGSYWCWDPKETWSLITWLIYGAYLHARLVHGWRGRRASWMALAGFAAVMFTFFGVNYLLPGLHSYA